MLKVMHVIHGLNMGGAETLVKEYALKLDKSKFDLTILCFNHFFDSPYEELLKKNKIKVIYIEDYQKYYGKRTLIFKVFNHMQIYLLIRKFIHQENPDILHTHLTINKYIKFSKPKKNTRIIHTVHSEPKRYWPSKTNPDYKAALYLVKKYGMKFICLHENMRKEINELFNVSNSIILNNGIDFRKFENLHDREEIRKKLNISASTFVVGHIGRFHKVKNHDFLVEVFSHIYEEKKDSLLLMIGTGEYKKYVEEKLLELNIKNFLILENRNDIPDLLNIMDAFVFPSIKEGIPLSLIEAQACKIPCFISDGISTDAIISNIVTRMSLGNSKEWADNIIDYKLPRKIELDAENWDMNKIIKKLEKIYREETIN